jgi:hypothetical protein
MHPNDAGPRVPAAAENHPIWVQFQTQESRRRLAEIMGGGPWIISPEESRIEFDRVKNRFEIRGFPSLKDREFFAAGGGQKVRLVGTPEALEQAPGVVFLAANGESPYLVPVQAKDLKDGDLGVCHLHDWGEFAAMKKLGFRIMVIEFPVERKFGLARAWIFDPERQNLIPSLKGEIPGLIPARNVRDVLGPSPEISWQPPRLGYPGAYQWMKRIDVDSLQSASMLGGLALFVAVCAAYGLGTDRRSPLALTLLRASLSIPAGVIVQGFVATAWPELPWLLDFVIALSGVFGVVALISLVGARSGGASVLQANGIVLLGLSLVSLPVLGLFQPLEVGGMSPLCIHLAAFGVGVCWTGIPASTLARLGVIALVAGGAWRLFGLVPWPLLLGITGFGLGVHLGCFRRWFWFVLLAAVVVELILRFRGAAPFTLGRSTEWTDLASSNQVALGDHLNMLGSPLFLGVLFLLGSSAYLGGKYAFYRLRQLMKSSPRLRSLALVAGATAIGGIVAPALMPASLLMLVAAAWTSLEIGLAQL